MSLPGVCPPPVTALGAGYLGYVHSSRSGLCMSFCDSSTHPTLKQIISCEHYAPSIEGIDREGGDL